MKEKCVGAAVCDKKWLRPSVHTKEMFIDKIEMSEITVNSDGSITLFYYDGDMFWGHSIEIDIDENGNYDNAHIVG